MFNNISEKDILDVFLESDTDEEECPIIDQKVSKKDSKIFLKAPKNLDVKDETCFGENSEPFEGQAETNPKVNITSKNVVDLTSIFPPADSEETQRGFVVSVVRQIGVEKIVGNFTLTRILFTSIERFIPEKIKARQNIETETLWT